MKKVLSLALALAFAVFANAHAQTWSQIVETSDYKVLTTSLVSPNTITNPVSTSLGKNAYVFIKPNGGSGVSGSVWLASRPPSGTSLPSGAISATVIPDFLTTAADGSYTTVTAQGARSVGVRLKFVAGATESVSITVVAPK